MMTFLWMSIAFPPVYAQNAKSGVNVELPTSTLTVGGSLEAAYREITASTALTDQDYYVTYNGTASGAVITLPPISSVTNQKFAGRAYKIKNVSGQILTVQTAPGNMIRNTKATSVKSFSISSGGYVDLVCSNNDKDWDLLITTGVDYTAIVTNSAFRIPTSSYWRSDNFTYETGNKWEISEVTTSSTGLGGGTIYSFRVKYLYTGVSFDIKKMGVIGTSSDNVRITCLLKLNATNQIILEVFATQLIPAEDVPRNGYSMNALFINSGN